jgi:hypothetical protein
VTSLKAGRLRPVVLAALKAGRLRPVVLAALVAIGTAGCTEGGRGTAKGPHETRRPAAVSGLDQAGVSRFLGCLAGTKERDPREVDEARLLDGLGADRERDPEAHAARLKDTCLPLLAAALRGIDRNAEAQAAQAAIRTALQRVKGTFEAHVAGLQRRRRQEKIDQALEALHRDFHGVLYSGGGLVPEADAPGAVPYHNVLRCLIPDLVARAKKIDKAPDSGVVVEAVYRACRADPRYAGTIRGRCFEKRGRTSKRDGDFLAVASKLSGDDRDLLAIRWCLDRGDRVAVTGELAALAAAWRRYRKAVASASEAR